MVAPPAFVLLRTGQPAFPMLAAGMARIIYGVHGTGHGHAIRALAVAQLMPEHEFFFVSHSSGQALLGKHHPVFEYPNPVTVVRRHRIRPLATLASLCGFLKHRRRWEPSLDEVFARLRPDAALTDYEHLVPRAARRAGLPCLSLDHQHIIPSCGAQVPAARYPDYLATLWAIRHLFSQASDYLVTSFFPPPQANNSPVLPPLLRPEVVRQAPRDGDYVLAYQGYSTFARFVPLLRQIGRPVMVYGLDRAGPEGNLLFKPNTEAEFIRDLAGCRYVLCGGGHSLMAEALFLGKPVISFPIHQAIEQYLNALNLDRLGYGRMAPPGRPGANFLRDFESRIELFRKAISGANFLGNDIIVQRIRAFLDTTV